MIFRAGCGTVSLAAHHFQTAQPSHSDDSSNASEPIKLDTPVCRIAHDVMATIP
jgi:hypothetical protein